MSTFSGRRPTWQYWASQGLRLHPDFLEREFEKKITNETMEEKTAANIYAKLGQVMKATKAIGKNQKNQQQGFLFRGIDDFMNGLHGLMADAGIVILPSEKEHIQESYATKNGGTQFRTRVHMNFAFVSTEDGSCVTADGWGEAADNGDKGYNKCKSIALKYVLMQMFLVPTADIADPDRDTPEEVVSRVGKEDPELELALQLVKEAASVEALTKVWRDNEGMQRNKAFYAAVQSKNRELSANTGA